MALSETERIERREHLWEVIAKTLETAVLIEWDQCHKIYIHTKTIPDFTCKEAYTRYQLSPAEMLETVQAWWDESCFLRFITQVQSVGDVSGYIALIDQCEEAYTAEDDEE